MQFYLSDENLDKQINQIRKKIKLSMNGVTADSMTEKGLVYKQNMGVAIPVLREIATNFNPSGDLAQRLWIIGSRETMILSILLQPLNEFTYELALSRINSIQHKEIVDVICLYLLSKTTFATQLSSQLIKSDKIINQVTGFILAARVSTQFSEAEVETIIDTCNSKIETDIYQLYNALALCLARFCRLNSKAAEKIRLIVDNFPTIQTPSQRHIANEVKLELDFFD